METIPIESFLTHSEKGLREIGHYLLWECGIPGKKIKVTFEDNVPHYWTPHKFRREYKVLVKGEKKIEFTFSTTIFIWRSRTVFYPPTEFDQIKNRIKQMCLDDILL